jgi:hypothetical protein
MQLQNLLLEYMVRVVQDIKLESAPLIRWRRLLLFALLVKKYNHGHLFFKSFQTP